MESYGGVAASAGYDTDESSLAKTLQVENAKSQKSYEVFEANGYHSYITSWSAGVPSRWGTYQEDLAAAEVARVTSLGDARINRASDQGDASIAWTSTTVGADVAYGEVRYGGVEGGGALVARSQTIADAHVAVTESGSLVDYVTAQSAAVRAHDQGLAGANRERIHAIAELDAERDREVSSATHNFHRASQHAWHEFRKNDAYTIDSSEIYEKIAKAAKARDVRVAKANETRVVGIAEARRDWTNEVGDLNVAFVEQLVAAQQDRASELRDEIIILATAVSAAQQTYLTTEAAAIKQHVTTTAGADATSQRSNASTEATYSSSVTQALNVKSEADATALGVYEVGMYADHASATSVYHTSENSSLSLYQKLVAAADHTWTVAKAAARNLYHESLSAIEASQTAQRNLAYLHHANSSASANASFAIGQSEVDRSFSTTSAFADAALYLAKKTAEADLIVAATDGQGAADIAYARAVRDRDNAYADANVEWVKTTAAANTSQVVGDIDYEEYNEIVAAADETRQRAIDAANEAFENAVDDAGTEQAVDLGAVRLAYVEAVGVAKVNYAGTMAAAEVGYADGSARWDYGLVAELAKATEAQENLLRAADYNRDIALAAQDVAYETRLRDAGATLANDRGLAEGDFHLAQAHADASTWASAAAAAPEDYDLRFRAAEAQSRATWFAALTGAYATYRSQVAHGEGQASVDLALVRQSQQTERAAATLSYEADLAAAQRQRTIDRAAAQNAGYVESTRHDSTLAIDVVLAEYEHANAYAQAIVDDEWTRESIDRNLPEEEVSDALKDAAYALAVDLAAVQREWQLATSSAEFTFAAAEAGTEHDLLDQLAAVESRFSGSLAQAEATRDVEWALAEQAKLVGESNAENFERESRALAAANFQTETYAATTTALDDFVLAMPRVEGQIHGIDAGFASGDLTFTANYWNGQFNDGEFAITGTNFTRHPSAGGATVSIGGIDFGVAATDTADGTGYIMYSVEDLDTRFSANQPHRDNSDHLIAVKYVSGQWYYDDNATLYAFTPVAGDTLIAAVDFDADTIQPMDSTNGIGGYLPWAEYQRDRAAADEAAWADLKDDYVQWQSDISAVRADYASQRATEYVSSVQLASNASLAYDQQIASFVGARMNATADTRLKFLIDAAQLTHEFRLSAADATYVHEIGMAAATRDGTSTSTIDQEYEAAIDDAEAIFEDQSMTAERNRDVALASAHASYVGVETSARNLKTASIRDAERSFVYTAAGLFFNANSPIGVEQQLAQLDYDFASLEAATRSSALSSLGSSSPWGELYVSDWTAREQHLASTLRGLDLDQRLATAEADRNFAIASTEAEYTLAMSRSLTETAYSNAQALAGLVASNQPSLVGVEAPEEFERLVPDPGEITIVSNNYNYSSVRPGALGGELSDYGYAGSWGWSGYGSYHYSGYGRYDFGDGGQGLVGGFGAYYGGWGYGYGAYNWGGWSPSYVSTSSFTSGAETIDPDAEVAGAEATIETLAAPVVNTTGQAAGSQPAAGPAINVTQGDIDSGISATPSQQQGESSNNGPTVQVLADESTGWTYEGMFESYLTEYGDEGLGLFAYVAQKGWEVKKGSYSWVSNRPDWWLDEENKVIYIGDTAWLGTTYRSNENSAAQLYQALSGIISQENWLEEIDLMIRRDYAELPWYARAYRLSTAVAANSIFSGIKNVENAWVGETIGGQKLGGWDRLKLGAVGSIETLLAVVPAGQAIAAGGAKLGLEAVGSASVRKAMAADLLFGFGEKAAAKLAATRAGQGFIRAYGKVYDSKYNKALFGSTKNEIKVGSVGSKAVTPDDELLEARLNATNSNRSGSNSSGASSIAKEVVDNAVSGNVTVIRNALTDKEFKFAQKVANHTQRPVIGPLRANQPGIDGKFAGGQPLQLKQTISTSPTAASKLAKQAGEKASNAGYSEVEVFIEAKNVTAEAIRSGPIAKILQQQESLSAIEVLTKDGWIRFAK